ncbi:MAG: hypothetical protein EP335_10605 [Alphaproteobacteria bacterium]|nr:MAG: hypothetical protein EP335_10605 [Alphaproteobacteria bacterium]
MRIAFLACPTTVPGSPIRRADAHEHDQMMDALLPAFVAAGDRLDVVSWDDPAPDWAQYDAAFIGTTWDYQHRYADFLVALAAIEAKTRLYNPLGLVTWNGDKRYLLDLEAQGVRLIPTVWADRATPEVVAAAFNRFGCDSMVAKRQVGAGAEGQHRLKRGEAVPDMPEPMMLQPFMPAIVAEGEYSFVFIGGMFSHALLKVAATGDYRIQSIYGGVEHAVEPSPADLAAAQATLAACKTEPLYARVDMVRGADGGLCLMELELVEPFLYPLQGPNLGPLFHQALKARLG